MLSARLTLVAAICIAAMACPAGASALDDINAQTAQGRTVFVVLTDASATDLAAARAVAKAAHKRTPNSAVVELNRSDPAQRGAVAQYRVAAAPVPLVLVVASNGFGVGAARPGAKGAVDRLVSLVPTAAKAEYLKVLSQRRVAMVVFSRGTMREQSPLFEEISAISRIPRAKLSPVLVNLDVAKEQRWIAEWKLDAKKIKRPLLIFVNAKGQILGRLEGAPKAAQMIKLSEKKIQGCQDPSCKDPNCRHGK